MDKFFWAEENFSERNQGFEKGGWEEGMGVETVKGNEAGLRGEGIVSKKAK